mgnify:CR=1 FL=1
MLLSFDAKQKLKLSVTRNKEYLSKYLLEEERVVGAMLDSKKLLPEGEGRYKYTVTSFKVFQLDINPVVSIAVENNDGILNIANIDEILTNDTKLVSIIWGQSEIGTIQPVQFIGSKCEELNIMFHLDGTQILSNGIFNWKNLKCDFLIA